MPAYPPDLCLSTLRPTSGQPYSSSARRALWNGRKVRPELTMDLADFRQIRRDTADRMSISGVQDKISVKVERGKLVATTEGGEYLLKPVPSTDLPRFHEDVPANEHVSMQIATQVFKIAVAANGLVYFADGSPGYVCRRFDRDFATGIKLHVEDFCQLSNRSESTDGRNFKYDASYEELGELVRRYCPAHRIELEKLFRLILFNYFIGNGDAHLKNFSILLSTDGDAVLTPAYDILNTALHLPNDSRTALDLFQDGFTAAYEERGFYSGADFIELGKHFELVEARVRQTIRSMSEVPAEATALIERSLLSSEAKEVYSEILADRARAIGQL